MNPTAVVNTKIDRQARTFHSIKADANGELPTRIEILQIGMWDTPYHGMFIITPDDMQQIVANFDAGVAMAGGPVSEGGIGLPIDFGHESGEEAAAWIKGLVIDGNSLFADPIEWTAAGRDAVGGGNYKCFSPEFYPGSMGGWEDPELFNHFIPNVLVGGGLTNIPLFKGLKPIMASAGSGTMGRGREKNVIYISASAKEKSSMTLEEVRAKNSDQLNEEEKTFLTDHKAELTTEEQTKFGFEPVAAAPEPAADPVAIPAADAPAAAAPVAASAAPGQVVMAAAEAQQLRETSEQYRKEKADAIVDEQIARGAIVADRKESWSKRLLASTGKDREELEAELKALPANAVMAGSIGNSKTLETNLVDEMNRKTKEKVEASVKAGKVVTWGTAQAELLREDKDLAARYEASRTNK